MDEIIRKKRRLAKLGFWAVCIGFSVSYLSTLSSYPGRFDNTHIGGPIVLIILLMAYAMVFSNRSPIGKVIMQLLPEAPVYVITTVWLGAAGAFFEILVQAGIEQFSILAGLVIVLLCGYVVALVPRCSDFLSRHGFPKKGLHAMLISLLVLTLLGIWGRLM